MSQRSVHRPAMDRLRQGVFSSLGNRITGARVCDLFAGTGSYGLEALSRGASQCRFIELNRNACSMIKENIKIVAKSMGVSRLNAKVLQGDAGKTLDLEEEPFDIVFVDPPYEMIESALPRLFPTIDRLLASKGVVVFEMPGRIEIVPDGWQLGNRIGKGSDQPTACFYQRFPDAIETD